MLSMVVYIQCSAIVCATCITVSTGAHAKVLGMMMWLLMWNKTMTLIGQNDSQREGNMDHIFPCTLWEGKYPSYALADIILKYT